MEWSTFKESHRVPAQDDPKLAVWLRMPWTPDLLWLWHVITLGFWNCSSCPKYSCNIQSSCFPPCSVCSLVMVLSQKAPLCMLNVCCVLSHVWYHPGLPGTSVKETQGTILMLYFKGCFRQWEPCTTECAHQERLLCGRGREYKVSEHCEQHRGL